MPNREDRDLIRKNNTKLVEDFDQEVLRPRMYRVLLWNDDFTPIEFVTSLVHEVFHKTYEEAATITLEVHNEGSAVAGIYTREIAETRCTIALKIARDADHPFQVTIEPD